KRSKSAAGGCCSATTTNRCRPGNRPARARRRLTESALVRRLFLLPLFTSLCCNGWILIVASSQRVHWSYQPPVTPILGDHDEVLQPTARILLRRGPPRQDPLPPRPRRPGQVPPGPKTEYRLHRLTCTACGTRTCAALPAGTPAGAYGPRLQAVLALLAGGYRVSKRAVRQLAHDLFGLSISPGMVARLQRSPPPAPPPPH